MRSFKNYYKILKVIRYASREEIRVSFRKLAKQYHPDTSKLDPETAGSRMRILLEAYRILMDKDKRQAYDLRFKRQLGERQMTYRESLRKKGDDPYSQSLLILYDLLNGNSNESLKNYERMTNQKGKTFDLLSLLGFADYLDCTFLLAEEYHKRDQPFIAVQLYEKAFQEDLKWNYFRSFRLEIQQRIRNIYCRQLAKAAHPRVAIGYYKILLNHYHFPKVERAFFNKKIAEAYCNLDEIELARKYLNQAFRLKKNLSGIKKIISKISASGGNFTNHSQQSQSVQNFHRGDQALDSLNDAGAKIFSS